MIDYWSLAKDFAPGDFVVKYMPSQNMCVSPYVGRVLEVFRGIGFMDVQWPFGTERMSPEEVIKVNRQYATYLPPMQTFSYYPGLEQERARLASNLSWRVSGLPIGFHENLAKLWHKGSNEVQSYDDLWNKYASNVEDSIIREEVAKVYKFAADTSRLFLASYIQKTSMYWAAQNRQHRATKAEVDVRRPTCPKCGAIMRKATYKMAEGQRIKLFACPKDLYLIKQEDILGPGGEPVLW